MYFKWLPAIKLLSKRVGSLLFQRDKSVYRPIIVENRSRIFSLLLTNISYESLPDAIKGYTSFVFHDAVPGDDIGFGDPIDHEEKTFHKNIRFLVNDIIHCLRLMNEQVKEEMEKPITLNMMSENSDSLNQIGKRLMPYESIFDYDIFISYALCDLF